MVGRNLARIGLAAIFGILWSAAAWGNAFVRGAYYRLGEDDPGAVAGQIGNDPTKDSFADKLDLARTGQPLYSSDVSPSAPSTLSMAFPNTLAVVGGAGLPAFYSRNTPLDMSQQGYALETWVKAASTLSDPGGLALVTYNGDPSANGFGFFVHGGQYVLKIDKFEKPLGPATAGEWHHLAFVHEFSSNSYFFDGKSIADSTTDPIPTAATGGFWLGGESTGTSTQFLFNGLIDETRYQTFNPLAAGAFDPTSFLIVPEPGSLSLVVVGLLLVRCRRFVRR